jgi:hypothetical protein
VVNFLEFLVSFDYLKLNFPQIEIIKNDDENYSQEPINFIENNGITRD